MWRRIGTLDTAVRSIVPTWHDVFLCLTWLIYIHKCGNASALWIRQCAALYLHDMMHLLCLTWLTYIYKYGNASALWIRQCAALYIHDMMHSCVWRELYIFTDVATHWRSGYGSAHQRSERRPASHSASRSCCSVPTVMYRALRENVGLFWKTTGLFRENAGLFWQDLGLFCVIM